MMQVLSLIDIMSDINGMKTIVIQSKDMFMTKVRKFQHDSGGAY